MRPAHSYSRRSCEAGSGGRREIQLAPPPAAAGKRPLARAWVAAMGTTDGNKCRWSAHRRRSSHLSFYLGSVQLAKKLLRLSFGYPPGTGAVASAHSCFLIDMICRMGSEIYPILAFKVLFLRIFASGCNRACRASLRLCL